MLKYGLGGGVLLVSKVGFFEGWNSGFWDLRQAFFRFGTYCFGSLKLSFKNLILSFFGVWNRVEFVGFLRAEFKRWQEAIQGVATIAKILNMKPHGNEKNGFDLLETFSID